MPNKTASQPQCKVAVSFQWECLEFPLVCDAVLPWVHHLSWRIFTIWGRDVIWSSIQRPSENPRCTKKTLFHGVKQTQLAVLIRVRVISCQKLYPSSERLVSTRHGSGALQGRPGQVSILGRLIRLSPCHFSFSFWVHCLWRTERTLIVAEQWLLLLLNSMMYLKPCAQWGPETLQPYSKPILIFVWFSIWFFGTYWSKPVALFSDSGRKNKMELPSK